MTDLTACKIFVVPLALELGFALHDVRNRSEFLTETFDLLKQRLHLFKQVMCDASTHPCEHMSHIVGQKR